jgi:SAM-dependent methyltransferase
MHKQVRIFFQYIQNSYWQYFRNTDVLDCGSLDINGNNRFLFSGGKYTGIDIMGGRNVDIVTRIHEFKPGKQYDVVISSEMLEHDAHYRESLQNMFELTKPKGMLLFTAAGTNRPEHGTTAHHPGDSPKTHDYYRNITVEMILEGLDLNQFSWFEISYIGTDIRFAGIRR